MVDKLAQSIEKRNQVAFQKVKEDILFLNNRIEIIDKSLSKHTKDSNMHTTQELMTTIHNLTKRIENLETENKKLLSQNTSKIDDLTKVEGIGPVISKALHQNEIFTFEELSKTTLKTLKGILEEHKLSQHDPSTWPKQAKLAANKEWEKLEIWQDELKGGKL